jgi:predicted O-methyltransferase YrrM
MPLPQALRRLTPDRLRDQPTVRAIALGTGLIPPRPMHSPREAAVLARLAAGAQRVVELGVYEGSSALVFCRALGPSAELHLVDPFIEAVGPGQLPPGWHANQRATRLALRRAARHDGPRLCWHVARSQDVGRRWTRAVDLVFVDGDHSPQGCREDWEAWHTHVRPGGAVAFHDARAGRPDGDGDSGPTAVVDELFRTGEPPAGWAIAEEVDTLVVARREG